MSSRSGQTRASADERTRRSAIRALLDRRDKLTIQAAVSDRELGTLQWQAQDPRTVDLSNPEPALLKVRKQTKEAQEAQQRVDGVVAELLDYAAGPCEWATRGAFPVQPQRHVSAETLVVGAPGPPPLRITIMTEAQLERRDGKGLRETLVVVCNGTATATVAQALVQGAAAGVEIRSSPMAVLDAARQHRSEHSPYAVECSLTELIDPSSATSAEVDDDPIDLGNGISYLPWSSQPKWNRGKAPLESTRLLYAAPSAARVSSRAAHAKGQILCGWCNISACVQYIGNWYANPTSSRADLYEMELTELAERNTDVILLCPSSNDTGVKLKKLKEPGTAEDRDFKDQPMSTPSSAQSIAGVLLYQLMQELDSVDVDLGDPDEDAATVPLCIFAPDDATPGATARCRNCGQLEGHPWHHEVEETDDWTTRTVLSYVIEAARNNDTGWHALWWAAYEQERDAIARLGSGSADDSARMRRAEEELLASMHVDAWTGAIGDYRVPEYDRKRACFYSSVNLTEQLQKSGEVDGGATLNLPRL